MNAYQQLKTRHQAEVDAFPMAFAFNQKQFDEGMAKLGLSPDDTDMVYGIAGTGGFYRRDDAPRFHEMFDRHAAEMQAAVDADKTGTGFITDMFFDELANHEYIITGSLDDTLAALDLTADEVNASKALLNGLQIAIKRYLKGFKKGLF
jgi:hypothetical protein